MKKNLLIIILLVAVPLTFLVCHQAFSFTHYTTKAVSFSGMSTQITDAWGDTTKIIRNSIDISPELPFNYSNTELNQQVSFDLKPISKRKFSVSFLNKNHAKIAVKIYDVIGNLIIEDKVSGKGYFYKEYDLSFYNTDLFIIEVGNSKYNKTKSLVSG